MRVGVEDQDLKRFILERKEDKEELRSHPYCCSGLKGYYTMVKPTRKKVSAKAPLLQMSPEQC